MEVPQWWWYILSSPFTQVFQGQFRHPSVKPFPCTLRVFSSVLNLVHVFVHLLPWNGERLRKHQFWAAVVNLWFLSLASPLWHSSRCSGRVSEGRRGLQGAVPSQGNGLVNPVLRNAHALPLRPGKNSEQLCKSSRSLTVLSVLICAPWWAVGIVMTRTKPLSQIESGKIKTNHILRASPKWLHSAQVVSEANLCFLGSVWGFRTLPKSDRSIKLVVATYSVKERGNRASALSNVGKKFRDLSSQPWATVKARF